MKSEWFRDALADLPPSSSKITLAATPRNQPLPEDQPAATASSNARRDHRAEVGNFSIKAEGDFGTTEVCTCLIDIASHTTQKLIILFSSIIPMTRKSWIASTAIPKCPTGELIPFHSKGICVRTDNTCAATIHLISRYSVAHSTSQSRYA